MSTESDPRVDAESSLVIVSRRLFENVEGWTKDEYTKHRRNVQWLSGHFRKIEQGDFTEMKKIRESLKSLEATEHVFREATPTESTKLADCARTAYTWISDRIPPLSKSKDGLR